MDRRILHCDANNFYASVEIALDPSLADKCIAVGGDERSRHGIVLAKNERAKAYGVQTAEVLWQARKKCPSLVVVPPHPEIYRRYSQRLFALYAEYTDRVEPFGPDEGWLDVSGNDRSGDDRKIAEDIRGRVREEIGLTVSVGVSFCKVFAKLASDLKKPDATTVVSRDDYRGVIWPLSVDNLLYVGKRTAAQLRGLGIYTVGDLALADPAMLTAHLGKNGARCKACAAGEDDEEVALWGDKEPPKSIGHATTLPMDINTQEELSGVLTALCDAVAARLRRCRMYARGVQVALKYADFSMRSKQGAIGGRCDTCRGLSAAAQALCAGLSCAHVRLVSVTALDLVARDEQAQLSLFDDTADVAAGLLCAEHAIKLSAFARSEQVRFTD